MSDVEQENNDIADDIAEEQSNIKPEESNDFAEDIAEYQNIVTPEESNQDESIVIPDESNNFARDQNDIKPEESIDVTEDQSIVSPAEKSKHVAEGIAEDESIAKPDESDYFEVNNEIDHSVQSSLNGIHVEISTPIDPQFGVSTDTTQSEVSKYKRKIVKPKKVASPTKSPPKEKKPPQAYVPSDSLTRTTLARKCDSQALSDQRLRKEMERLAQEKHKGAITVKNFPPPSEHLMKTTQNRICDIREWEDHKGRIKDGEDIWWEMRRSAEKAKPRNVPSKLHSPTKASIVQQREKHNPDSPGKNKHKVIQKIDPGSPLLKPTRQSIIQNWGGDPNASPPPPPTLHLSTDRSGFDVVSKYDKPTVSANMKKWKSKEEIEKEEQEALQEQRKNSMKVKEPSDRLLHFNTAMRQYCRTKAEKEAVDPREAGWNDYYHKDEIPSIEEGALDPNPVRRHSTGGILSSPKKSPRRASHNEETAKLTSLSNVFDKVTRGNEGSVTDDLSNLELSAAQQEMAGK